MKENNTAQRNLPKQERSVERVKQIIDSAAVLFDEMGIANATPSDIAKASGLTRTSLYRYFPNKASIIRALAERHLEVLQGRLSLVPSGLALEERIDIVIGIYAELYRDEPGYMAVWSGVDSLPELKDIDKSAFNFHSSLIEKQIANVVGDVGRDKLQMIAIILARTVGSILRLAIQESRSSEKYLQETKLLAKAYLTSYGKLAD